ncbi:class I SAM-dependent methyltransferase [Gloeobacter violaceus]|uniref:Gll3184 protein n=1 Tax=Gloeobacter violaceus (strain ATCC 29082 / PCC 7421) TaxID=251221 RepID=Q7NGI5_GLOVI|nr:class I SAM-dependent methyltransferase [Gloeobacter violaceus]BAC91125.1 gll3184 [Gloeobacter violaceus PCC 7421]
MQGSDEDLSSWFDRHKEAIERSYLVGDDPYLQSGWASTPERWLWARRVILKAVPHSGSFFDIGCANGLLLECLVQWANEQGVRLEPHGIDFSEALVELARTRLPAFADNLAVANAHDWQPQRAFDYVHTLLEYVPEALQQEYLDRLLRQAVLGGGRLIVSSYSSRRTGRAALDVASRLGSLGFRVEGDALSHDEDGWVLTHTTWLGKSSVTPFGITGPML